jgi:hypothetical protein
VGAVSGVAGRAFDLRTVTRFAPMIVLVAVTALLLGFGHYPWSWLAGPIASLLVWAFDHKARESSAPAHARGRRPPAAVD